MTDMTELSLLFSSSYTEVNYYRGKVLPVRNQLIAIDLLLIDITYISKMTYMAELYLLLNFEGGLEFAYY